MRHGHRLVPLIISLPVLGACGDSTGPLRDHNLVVNGSFERAGLPDSTGWTSSTQPRHEFVEDAPPGGGDWATVVYPGTPPQQGCIEQRLTGLSVRGTIAVSAWARSKRPEPWTARIELNQRRNGVSIRQTGQTRSVQGWTLISYVDTLSTLPTDTLDIRLCAGVAELAADATLFDLVTVRP